MLNSLNNHQYTNISSNIEYQIPNNYRTEISLPYDDDILPEQKISYLFQIILEENTQILNYLLIKELTFTRWVNKKIKKIIDKYFSFRISIEYNDIKNFEKRNTSKKEEFLKIYELQIPISNNDWFYYDIERAIETILRLDRKTIAQLRGIKKLPNLDENIYAPFCIIFNFNSKNEEVIKNGWKKISDNIISDSKFFINIANLKFENFEDEDILEAFAYLNEIEKSIDKINRYSFALYEMNNWCKAVVIYHILVHPYKNRNNQNSIEIGSEIYKYINFMDGIINKFYLFKGYLEIKKLIKPKLGEYIFTFGPQIPNDDNNKDKQILNELLNEINDEKIISNIISYLPLKESFLFINVNKFFFNCFKKSLNILCYNFLNKIFILKYESFNDLYTLVPTIFENNIFSNYFFMLEDIINPSINYKEPKFNFISFLTKDNINDIKNYKGNNELINSICKIFCNLFNIKPQKTFDQDYNSVNLYIKSVILICFKGKISTLIRYFNVYNLNNNQIKVLYEELSNVYSIEKIKKVKNVNKGFYQLLLWEIYLFEYVKQFNPFLFVNKNLFLNNESLNENQKNIIKVYIEFMDRLKTILNFKYHFDLLFLNKNKNNSYKFISIISNEIKILKEDYKYENIEYIIEAYNKKQKSISEAYFQCKNLIENRNLPYFYRRIMEELILINVEMVNGEENNDNKMNNDEIKDENFYINIFLRINDVYNKTKKNRNENFFAIKENYSNNFFPIKNSYYNKKLKNKNDNIDKYNDNIKIEGYKKKYNDIVPNIKTRKNNMTNEFSPQDKINFTEKYFTNDKKEPNYYNIYNANKSFNFKSSSFNLKNNDKVIFYDIPEEIVITKILFYLSIYDFPKLSLVNHFFYGAIKTHIYIRLFFLEKTKNNIEKKYSDIIIRITNKRNQFYKENNLSTPSLKHACLLFSHFNKNDIYELKILFKQYKKEFEIIISILCIFLDIKPKIYLDEEGKKIIDFFSVGKNLIYRKDFINIIQNMDIDSLNYETFRKIEKIFQNEAFSLDKLNKLYSPCLINLIYLEMGVMEYFRAIRKYCLNFYDYYILEEDEKYFCKRMDDILKIYYIIKNYAFNKCQEYHQKSINYLKIIDLEQNFFGEIVDFNNESIGLENYNKATRENNFNNNGMNINNII